MISLSVLDQSPIRPGMDAAAAIAETRELARLADRLGYRRYWLAEHHSTKALAGAAPEILIGQIASETAHIRVGSGGVMLMHYSPLKVAEQFRMLETLHPGRIDLGLGRAPGAEGRTMAALQAGPKSYSIEAFPQLLELLVRYLEDAGGIEGPGAGFPADHPFRGIHAGPMGKGMPEIWLLGSGIHSAVYAAQLGQSFAHAYFINPEGGEEACEAYRRAFRPSAELSRPRIGIGVAALAAETAEAARRASLSRNIWALKLLTGRPGPFPSRAEAEALRLSENDHVILRAIEARSAAGTPAEVRTKLLALAERHGAEEIFLVTISDDHADRLRSYELLAEAFGLKRQ